MMTGNQQKAGSSNGAIQFGNATGRASCAAFKVPANYLEAILSLVRSVVCRFHCRIGGVFVVACLRYRLIRGIDLIL